MEPHHTTNALCCCQTESRPLLNLEVEPDWHTIFPVCRLPPLPARSSRYFVEPWIGSSVVCVISAVLVGLTCSAANPSGHEGKSLQLAWLAIVLIWLQAILAVGCMLFLLFGDPGEIRRDPSNCYPIPDTVTQSLLRPDLPGAQRNIDGINGSSYCVRCLVWRPGHIDDGGPGHHCNTCQRCVVGFDHHCGVFGRCITSGNMPCFYTLIAMLFTGLITTGVTLMMNTSPQALAIFTSSGDVGYPHEVTPWHRPV